MKNPKKRCWACDNLAVTGWGKRAGKQRFKCKQCAILFTRNNPIQIIQNRFV